MDPKLSGAMLRDMASMSVGVSPIAPGEPVKPVNGHATLAAGLVRNPGLPLDLDWVRSLRDQCRRARVAFFFKQMLEKRKKVSLPLLDGRQWAEVPDV